MLANRITDISIDASRKVPEVHGGGSGISVGIHQELLDIFVWKMVGLTCYLRKVELSKILTHYVGNRGVSVFLRISF